LVYLKSFDLIRIKTLRTSGQAEKFKFFNKNQSFGHSHFAAEPFSLRILCSISEIDIQESPGFVVAQKSNLALPELTSVSNAQHLTCLFTIQNEFRYDIVRKIFEAAWGSFTRLSSMALVIRKRLAIKVIRRITPTKSSSSIILSASQVGRRFDSY